MTPPRLPILACLLIALAASPATGAPAPRPDSRPIAESGRTLDYILDQVLGPDGAPGPREIILLLDPSPGLATARFADRFATTLGRHGTPDLAVGLAVVGDRRHPRVAPTTEHAPVLVALREALRDPKSAVRDVYTPIRGLAGRSADEKVRRTILLVSLENGDGEDDLEKTGDRLEKSGVRLIVVGRTALVGDSYWVRQLAAADREGRRSPAGLDMHGPEAAYDDLPWGWILQYPSTMNEYVPSGFGLYGLARLVARSRGTYFTYAPPSYRAYERCQFGRCRICDGEHADCGRRYEPHRLRDLAPVLESRVDRRRALARDPLFLAVLDAWNEASEANLVYSRPPLRRGPGLLREETRRAGGWGGLLADASFASVARRAEKLEAICTRLAGELETALEATETDRTSARTRALAETTRTMLLVTRLNLRLLREFCERAPDWHDRPMAGRLAPEAPFFEPGNVPGRSIVYETICFCHGTEAVLECDVPGLAEAGAIRDEAFAAVDDLRRRYEGTPYGRIARLMGVAVFDHAVAPEDAHASVEGRQERGAAGGRGGAGTTTGGR